MANEELDPAEINARVLSGGYWAAWQQGYSSAVSDVRRNDGGRTVNPYGDGIEGSGL